MAELEKIDQRKRNLCLLCERGKGQIGAYTTFQDARQRALRERQRRNDKKVSIYCGYLSNSLFLSVHVDASVSRVCRV